MGYQVDNPDILKADELNGGYIRQNKRVYKGVVRNLRTGEPVWICDHIHSRPEYNARWQCDPVQVWEYSALNCGHEAHFQWRSSRVLGRIGLVGEDLASGHHKPRDDMKEARIGSVVYNGHVWLSLDGNRLLSITRPDKPDQNGIFYLDTPKNTIQWPVLTKPPMDRWLVATYWLSREVWGVVFRNPDRPIHNDFDPEIAKEFRPKRTKQAIDTTTDEPYIRTIREDGKRRYAVCSSDGTVMTTKPHRGQAAKELHRLKGSK